MAWQFIASLLLACSASLLAANSMELSENSTPWPIDPNFQVPNTTAWLVDPDESNLPAVDPETFSIDWRRKGAVTPVKSQCGGTCWSFSATGNMEGAWAAAGHGLVSLSEQFLQDGCSGSGSGPYGIPVPAAKTHGLAPRENQYPTTKAGTPNCGKKACVKTGYSVQINKVEALRNGGPESDILNWLQRGPVGISIAAGGLSGYKSGILGVNGGDCSVSQLDHAVLIVGYGQENGQKYWIMKNSWGTGFGESGFWRMKYGVNCLHLANGGPCQVTSVGRAPSPSPTPPSPGRSCDCLTPGKPCPEGFSCGSCTTCSCKDTSCQPWARNTCYWKRTVLV